MGKLRIVGTVDLNCRKSGPTLRHCQRNCCPHKALSALAGQLCHCATYGDDCGHDDELKRQRCTAFEVHAHMAAASVHRANRAGLSDHLPTTWVVDRSAQVIEANAAAKA